jgi:hypothetical protein
MSDVDSEMQFEDDRMGEKAMNIVKKQKFA